MNTRYLMFKVDLKLIIALYMSHSALSPSFIFQKVSLFPFSKIVGNLLGFPISFFLLSFFFLIRNEYKIFVV